MIVRTLLASCAGLAAAGAGFAQPQPSSGESWQVAGNLGIMQFVVVPVSRAHQWELYAEAIRALCPPEATCFLRFFTNSTQATPAVPLPDAILAEPAAIFQRSTKQGNEVFQWSCRLGMPGNCF